MHILCIYTYISLSLSLYMYIYIYIHMCIHPYTYLRRTRGRKAALKSPAPNSSLRGNHKIIEGLIRGLISTSSISNRCTLTLIYIYIYISVLLSESSCLQRAPCSFLQRTYSNRTTHSRHKQHCNNECPV